PGRSAAASRDRWRSTRTASPSVRSCWIWKSEMWKSGNLAAIALAVTLCAAPARAEVVTLEILSREPMANGFELIKGRIHGEIDPKNRHNTIIQDIDLAPRNARGKVEYLATFALATPIDPAKSPPVLP